MSPASNASKETVTVGTRLFLPKTQVIQRHNQAPTQPAPTWNRQLRAEAQSTRRFTGFDVRPGKQTMRTLVIGVSAMGVHAKRFESWGWNRFEKRWAWNCLHTPLKRPCMFSFWDSNRRPHRPTATTSKSCIDTNNGYIKYIHFFSELRHHPFYYFVTDTETNTPSITLLQFPHYTNLHTVVVVVVVVVV